MNAKQMQIAFETSAKVIDLPTKPLTVDIFYFINLAQNNYVKQLTDAISTNKNKAEVNSKINELQTLIKRIRYFTVGGVTGFLGVNQPNTAITSGSNPDNRITFTITNGVRLPLPTDFTLYVNSTSSVKNTTIPNISTSLVNLTNKLVEETDLNNSIFNTLFNSMPVLRNGYVTLEQNASTYPGNMTVYTGDLGLYNIELTYLRIPADMSLDTPTVECELPEITHNTIVDMAIDYYLTSNIPSQNQRNQYAG